MSKAFWAEEVDEATARKVAEIVGPHSSYGRALAEAERRRAAGEDVALVKTKNAVVVVPRSHISNVVQMPGSGDLQ